MSLTPGPQHFGKNGIYAPKDWGQNWRQARSLYSTQLIPIVGWGHSNMCYYSSNFRTKGWFGKVITDLQALYSDGGSGYLSGEFATGVGATGATYMTGSNFANNALAGINERTIQLNASGTLTIPAVRGTSIDLHHIETTTPNVSYNYNIDGTGAVPVVTGSKGATRLAAAPTTISGLTAAGKSVVLTVGTITPAICGINGYNPSGIIGHMMAQAGRTSAGGNVVTYLTGSDTSRSVSITPFAPRLFIYGVGGVNDIGGALSLNTFYANASRVLRTAKAHLNGACDILIVGDHLGSTVDANNLFSQYTAALKSLADDFGAACYLPWPDGRNSWDYWNSLGYWGVTNGAGGEAGTDGVHPSDAGHAHMASRVLELVAN